jgi:hypothetical protein
MSAPLSGTRPARTDYVANARVAWGDDPPAEVLQLALEANATSGAAAAKRIGYSGAVVTQLIGRKYPGDVGAVFARIRGALMGETVGCPVLGDIARDQCLDEQKRPFSATNSTRARLWHACQRCPNNRQSMKASA